MQTVKESIPLSEDAVERDISKVTCYSVDMGGGKSACMVDENKSPTLTCTHYGEPAVAYQKGNGVGVDLYNGAITGETAVTILSESNITSTRVGPFILENRNGKDD